LERHDARAYVVLGFLLVVLLIILVGSLTTLEPG
jgi:hypothetical protein